MQFASVETVKFAGRCNVGGVVSTTETVKLAAPRLLCKSVAVHCTTVVVSSWKAVPLGGVQVTGRSPSTRSVAVTVYVPTVVPGPVASAMIGGSGVTVNTGGVVSTTVTVKLAVLVCPLFVAVQFTVVVPSANVEPEAGVHVRVESGGATITV